MSQQLTIESGFAHVIFAYDAARSINLDIAERRIHEATQRQTIKHKKRAPSYFEYQPPPVRVSQDVEALNLGKYHTHSSVELVVYDFGAISVIYSLPIQAPFSDLLELSEELYDNELLLTDSRTRVEQFLKVVADAATKAGLADIVEDYVIFSIDAFDQPLDVNGFSVAHAQEIARILRAERRPLSDQEVSDALAARISFSTDDLTLVDWNAALLIDREGEDVRAVLEFANVELLEMRYLDQRLDRALDQAYETLSRRSWGLPRFLVSYGADLRRVAELQVDNATLFEGVNNTLKLLGDQYLARVYRLANRRFHLDEWDGAILRKLQTLESIYEKISDQAANRRMEILEWVIIILIAFSILLEFVPRPH
ncbi:MAG TPA: hypothetical protein VFU31_28355 [Candidatus Binatia bacterium]|nr:hypothetical protein [Candidatus Binatia bacterium]